MKLGRPRKSFPANTSPTMGDIREAAAFYEGEGHVIKDYVIIGQQNREKLDWIQARFGGKVYGPYLVKATGNNHYYLRIARERALGFMFTVFTFLSKTRREQFIKTLN